MDLYKIKNIPEKNEISIQGINIKYHDLGEGYPIFCIPGWTAGATLFLPFSYQIDGVRIISLDIPTIGGFSEEYPGEVNLENLSMLIADFIKAFKIEKYSIMGYSLGGFFVQNLIKKKLITPEKIILNSTFHSGENLYKHRGKGLGTIESLITRGFPPKILSEISDFVRFVRRTLGQKYQTKSLVFQQLKNEIKNAHNKKKFEIFFDIKNKDVLSEHLKEYETLLIVGEKDLKVSLEGMNEIADYLSENIEVVSGQNHGHLMIYPEITAKFVREFLSDKIN